MSQNIHLFHILKQQVLVCAGFRHILPSDCRILSNLISIKTKLFLSETTLKRIYGFAQSKFETSLFTKNALACFCGYAGWEDYRNVIQVGYDQQDHQKGSVQTIPGLKEKEIRSTGIGKHFAQSTLINSDELCSSVIVILKLLEMSDVGSVRDQQNRVIIQRLQTEAQALKEVMQQTNNCASDKDKNS